MKKTIYTFLVLATSIQLSSQIVIHKIDSMVMKGKHKTLFCRDSFGKNYQIVLKEQTLDSLHAKNSYEPSNIYPSDTSTKTAMNDKPKEKYHQFNTNLGLMLGSIFEWNNTAGTPDKTGLAFNIGLDFTHRYNKPTSKISLSNELHYVWSVQKDGLLDTNHFQNGQDELMTLHDWSIGFTEKNKWNINLITKFSTSLFHTFDGNYFADITGLGRIRSPLSPFIINLAPGIKYNVNDDFRISISPFSAELYGVTNSEISSKGIYITDTLAGGQYKKGIIRKEGVELNLWFDKQIKEWLNFQWRLTLSSDYKQGFLNNAVADGLFITKLKLIKDIYVTHRFTLNSDLFSNLTKPFMTQNIQLSYSKSF